MFDEATNCTNNMVCTCLGHCAEEVSVVFCLMLLHLISLEIFRTTVGMHASSLAKKTNVSCVRNLLAGKRKPVKIWHVLIDAVVENKVNLLRCVEVEWNEVGWSLRKIRGG